MAPEPLHRFARVRFVAALAVAMGAVAACSSGVDGYHFADGSRDSGGSHGDGGDTSQGGDGNGGAVASNGGRTPTGGAGSGNSAGQGDGGTNTGGKAVTMSGGTGAGGSGNGGTQSGGAANGGAGNGGKAGSGGAATGGVGNGGMGTGGMNTVGPSDPTTWVVSEAPAWNIVGAAWDGSAFFLLDAGAKTFWQVDPMAKKVVGAARPLPSAAVSPQSFAATAQWIYFVAGGAAYRIPHSGYTTGAGVTMTFSTNPIPRGAASLSDSFLVGDSGAGKSAEALIGGTRTSPPLGKIYGVGADSQSFVFSTLSTGASGVIFLIHRAKAGALLLNANPCQGPAFGSVANQLSVYGKTAAWVVYQGTKVIVSFATIDDSGTCQEPVDRSFFDGGSNADGVGLVDDNYALVMNRTGGTLGTLMMIARPGFSARNSVPELSLGSINVSIVVGGAHDAVLVSEGNPTFVKF